MITFVLIVLRVLLIYLIASFVAWSFNPSEWGLIMRFISGIFAFYAITCEFMPVIKRDGFEI